jgi:Ca2+-transporting ATPase
MSHFSPQPEINWHTLSVAEVCSRLDVDAQTGLPDLESSERLARFGANALRQENRRSLVQMLISQFSDFMIIVLLVAAAISGIVGEPIDAITILTIVILNAIIGTVQEYRADKSIAALMHIATPEAKVIRDGQVITVSSVDLVTGDVVMLEAGDIVPADMRLIIATNLETDESALTGESQTVSKHTDALVDADSPLGDRQNMAFNGTFITNGRGQAIVTNTGMSTEIGKIAYLLDQAEQVKTPLQKRLVSFGRHLTYAILIICAIIFVAGLLRGEPLILMFLTAVSLAIAAIPEALPAVVTMALAMGASKMSKRNALIRRLPAVETLGSVTYICSDKTGTLTQNRMKVEQILLGDQSELSFANMAEKEQLSRSMGYAMALNNNIEPATDGEALGDPTEIALFRFALTCGYDKSEITGFLPRVAELPFDADRKRMSTIHQDHDAFRVFVKGAPEYLLPQCKTQMQRNGDELPLQIEDLQIQAGKLAYKGYRVIAYACRDLPQIPEPLSPATVESELVFLGFAALIDPPRDEVAQAVQDCFSAGIIPVMITGDHPATAQTIARQLGIIQDHGEVITGRELQKLSHEELVKKVLDIHVYARVNPEQKIRIVQALQDNGEFTAMTGDGVNDAPALKQADIGISMGRKGTDVAHEASDMILLDDNFSTIVKAVREGRRSFDNIRKFIKYTMTSNSGEIWTLFLAPFLGLPIPLLPIHILWINLVTDGLPGLALAAEPEERGNMQRPPRPPNESIFAHGMWQHMIWVGLLIGGLSIFTQYWAIQAGSENWQTMVFTVLTVSQLFHSMAIRSECNSLFSIGLTSNMPLLGAVTLTLAIQLAAIYMPIMNTLLKTQPLTMQELSFCLALSSVVLFAVEIEKLFKRRGLLNSDRKQGCTQSI